MKLIVLSPLTYWSREAGTTQLAIGEYTLNQVPRECLMYVNRPDGVNCYVVLDNGSTRPSHCVNHRYDNIRGINELMAKNFTSKMLGNHIVWEANHVF